LEIPLAGTIARCTHGVYDPDGKGRFCQLCNPKHCKPPNNKEEARAARFSMPRSSNDPLNENGGKLHANPHDPRACPKCGSNIHFSARENGKGRWLCADCGEKFPAPKGRS